MSTPYLSRLLAPVLIVATIALVGPSSVAGPLPESADKRQATRVTGWTAAPDAVAAGSTYVARVRVTGQSRPVHLQRLLDGSWRTVGKARSGPKGFAALRWSAARRPATVVLRVLVPQTDRRTGAVTKARIVRVNGAVGGQAPSKPEPSATPTTPEPTAPAAPAVPVDSSTPADPGNAGTGVTNPALRELLALVNQTRSRGYTCDGVAIAPARPLRAESRLGRAAEKFATAMATQGFFSHTGADGSGPGERIKAEGYPWRAYGETISAGRDEPADVVQAWLDSPGHCRILMSASYTEVGLGQAVDAGSQYGTYWVLVAADR